MKAKHRPGLGCTAGPYSKRCYKCRFLLEAAPQLLAVLKEVQEMFCIADCGLMHSSLCLIAKKTIEKSEVGNHVSERH